MSTPGTIQATVDQILGSQTYGAAKSFLSSGATQAYTAVSSTASSYTGGDTGGYLLSTLFYFLLYTFVLFLILILFHFTVRPVFSFVPGGRGFLKIPSTKDDKVYWNDKKQPIPDSVEARVPVEDPMKVGVTDTLSTYDWIKDFTMSVDLYIRKLQETEPRNRIVLYKTYRHGATGIVNNAVTNVNEVTKVESPLATGPSSGSLTEYMITTNAGITTYKCSMLVWLSDANDLNVTFFTPTTEASCRPIKNIPLNEPFRLTVVVESNLFTVYLNGKQTFQKVVSPSGIILPTYSVTNQPERFYPPPAWADTPVKAVYVQNLHLWPRAIGYDEVITAQPALAKKEDFDLPQDVIDGKCS